MQIADEFLFLRFDSIGKGFLLQIKSFQELCFLLQVDKLKGRTRTLHPAEDFFFFLLTVFFFFCFWELIGRVLSRTSENFTTSRNKNNFIYVCFRAKWTKKLWSARYYYSYRVDFLTLHYKTYTGSVQTQLGYIFTTGNVTEHTFLWPNTRWQDLDRCLRRSSPGSPKFSLKKEKILPRLSNPWCWKSN